jgi:hypothetical protein
MGLPRYRKLGLTPPTSASAVIPSHPALGVLALPVPEALAPQMVTSFGPGKRYVPIPGGVAMRPGELTLSYAGGLIDTHAPFTLGWVNRQKQQDGIVFGWIHEFIKMPVSTLPFFQNALPIKSTYQQWLRKRLRISGLNAGWWRVIGGMGANTGYVAPTNPGARGGRVATPYGLRQDYRYGVRQAPWTPLAAALEIPRPSTRPRLNPAISVMPPS